MEVLPGSVHGGKEGQNEPESRLEEGGQGAGLLAISWQVQAYTSWSGFLPEVYPGRVAFLLSCTGDDREKEPDERERPGRARKGWT